MKTTRLAYAPHRYRVDQTVVPAGYVKGASVAVDTAPSGIHRITVRAPPKPRTVVKTRDAQTGFLVKGACYTVAFPTGGAAGTFCDADDANDGITTTAQLTPGTYKLIQKTAPAGYEKAPDREITVVAGRDKVVTVQNAPVEGHAPKRNRRSRSSAVASRPALPPAPRAPRVPARARLPRPDEAPQG